MIVLLDARAAESRSACRQHILLISYLRETGQLLNQGAGTAMMSCEEWEDQAVDTERQNTDSRIRRTNSFCCSGNTGSGRNTNSA
jgi:hypothetical protein